MTERTWTALSGVFTSRYDEPLTELGRSNYHGHQVTSDPFPEGKLTVVERYHFGVLTEPWRMAFVSLLVDNADEVPAFASTDVQMKRDWVVQAMLDPSPLSQIADLPDAGSFRVPGPPVEADLFLVPALVVLSSEYYEAEMDRDLRILTSWKAFIRGRLAVELTVEPVWWEG